jgi:hypothetical protein
MYTKLNRMNERIEVFQAAWLENAPDAVFAGMTLAEFKEAVKAPVDLRDEIQVLDQQVERTKVDSLKAISAATEVLDLVVNSVRGTPGFGADCALYRALGYVRKSERKTGLTRKPRNNPSTDAK